MFLSNAKYYIKSTISSVQVAGTTFNISTDFENSAHLETGTKSVSIVLKSGSQIERMEITATGGVATIVKRGLTQEDVATEDPLLQKQWTDGTVMYITALAYDYLDRQTGLLYPYADAADRDAKITNPENGMQVYLVSEGYFTDYAGGTWVQRANGATPNATDAISGKVEIATTAESKAGTNSGGTGANLSVLPSDIAANTQNQSFTYAVDTGTANAYVVSLTPAPTSYVDWMVVCMKPLNNNTWASTINVNGLWAKNIKNSIGNNTLSADEIKTGITTTMVYNGSDFVLQASSPALFGGDWSDWDITGALTITGSDNSYIVKQYNSFAPWANTVTITPTGCILHIKVKWNLNLTWTTLSFAWKWVQWGAGWAWASQGYWGYTGSSPTWSVISIKNTVPTWGWGGAGSTPSNGSPWAWGGGGCGFLTDWVAGSNSSAGAIGGIKWSQQVVVTWIWGAIKNLEFIQPWCGGAGGGGGWGGYWGGWAPWGTWGAGGWCVIFEVLWNVTISWTTATFAWVNGSAGWAGSFSSAAWGGGGGWSWGALVIAYKGTLSWTLIPTLTGGTWWAGGTPSSGGTAWAGGAGGTWYYNIFKYS